MPRGLVNSSYSPLEKMTRVILECGSLLPLLHLELARDAAGSKLPTKESGPARRTALQTVYYSKHYSKHLTLRAALLLF